MTALPITEYLARLAALSAKLRSQDPIPSRSEIAGEIDAIRDVLDRREAEGWRDISTAPKDGTIVLVYVPDFDKVTEAWFCEQTGLWPRDNAYSEEGEPCNIGLPTHWRPLPAPPTTPTTEASMAHNGKISCPDCGSHQAVAKWEAWDAAAEIPPKAAKELERLHQIELAANALLASSPHPGNEATVVVTVPLEMLKRLAETAGRELSI